VAPSARTSMAAVAARTGGHLRLFARAARSSPAARRELVRSYLFLLLGRATPVVATDHDGLIYCVLGKDRGVGRHVFAAGGYDDDLLACVVRTLEDRNGAGAFRGRTFIDIGANIGTSSIPAILRFGASDAIAFEPGPDAFKVLHCNVILNGLDERVRLFQVALSDNAGVAELEIAAADSGDSRIRKGPPVGSGEIFGESRRDVIAVATRRFDDVVETDAIDLGLTGLVWIDAQGHEAQILSGAQTLLASDVPVVLEYWPYGLKRSGGMELLHDIVAWNYREVIDLRTAISKGRVEVRPADSLRELGHELEGPAFTDLMLLK
jgi:FkbM family methyltransferase